MITNFVKRLLYQLFIEIFFIVICFVCYCRMSMTMHFHRNEPYRLLCNAAHDVKIQEDQFAVLPRSDRVFALRGLVSSVTQCGV